MYDKRRVKLPTTITLDYILSKVTEYDIYAHYLGQFKVGAIYIVPFGRIKTLLLESTIVSEQDNFCSRIMVMVNVVM